MFLPLADDSATEDAAPPSQTFDISAQAWTEAIIKELLTCLHEALVSSSSALPHIQPLSTPPLKPYCHVDSQAVVDVCSLIFTLFTRCRSAMASEKMRKMSGIFIIHGDESFL